MKQAMMAAAAVLLAGCTNGSLVYHSGYGRYSGSTALVAAPNGEMAVAVYGNPTSAPADVFAAAVADGMKGTHVDHRTVFKPTAMPDTAGYRTVVVFGATTQNSICSFDGPMNARAEAPGPMGAAFCLGDEALSYVSGRVPGLTGPDDPMLERQMSIVGLTLFPPTNPNYDNDCEYDTIFCR